MPSCSKHPSQIFFMTPHQLEGRHQAEYCIGLCWTLCCSTFLGINTLDALDFNMCRCWDSQRTSCMWLETTSSMCCLPLVISGGVLRCRGPTCSLTTLQKTSQTWPQEVPEVAGAKWKTLRLHLGGLLWTLGGWCNPWRLKHGLLVSHCSATVSHIPHIPVSVNFSILRGSWNQSPTDTEGPPWVGRAELLKLLGRFIL